jgi:hypothetical protein
MLLLDVCWFSRSQFRIAGYVVKRHSTEEIRQLGPGFEVTESFYRRERLDPEWYSQQWFLEKTENAMKKPGTLTAHLGGDIVLDDHWQPLLILSLYSPVCFDVPVVVENEQNWDLAIRKFSHPHVNIVGDEEGQEEVPYRLYEVEERQWSAFQQFTRRIESGLSVSHGWARIRVAARRLLRATFLSDQYGDAWAGDDADDVLLQYVFALEALLNTGGEAISEKIALRTALLVGRTDEERIGIRRLVRAAYASRSALVHRGESGGEVDLPQLRNICRRAIAVSIGIAASCDSEKKFTDRIEEALVSHSVQKDLQTRAIRIQHLMKDLD